MSETYNHPDGFSLKGYSTFFLEIGSFYNSPRVKLLGFTISLTSIVGKKYTMEVNETRNCLFTDILLNIRKSSEYIRKW